jgi:hypothetical protein
MIVALGDDRVERRLDVHRARVLPLALAIAAADQVSPDDRVMVAVAGRDRVQGQLRGAVVAALLSVGAEGR